MTKMERSFRLADPGRVVRIALERRDELTITIDLVAQGESSDTPMRLTFRGARDVRFRGDRTELTGIVLLVAEDITARGWEGVGFEVKDYEEELVSFVCREIERPQDASQRTVP